MTTGLTSRHLDIIRRVCATRPEVTGVLLYGSRARGSYREGSDIDLALNGNAITRHTLLALRTAFDDSSLPYFVDLVHLDILPDGPLRDNILAQGQSLFTQLNKNE